MIILYMSNANFVAVTTVDFIILSKIIHLISILYRLLLYMLYVAELDSDIIVQVHIRKCNQVLCVHVHGCLDSLQAEGFPAKTEEQK